MSFKLPYIICVYTFLFFGFVNDVTSQVQKVEVRQNANGDWQLLRNGTPYYIKGAGGSTLLDKLVEIGGNSIRTWSTDNAMEMLDEAHSKGLTVMMGLWVQHERHGFDYDDKIKVALQLEGFRKVVEQLKNHPALLLWSVGNEVDLNYTNTNVWYAVNDIAAMIHEVDPNHPTTTITAGLDSSEVKLIKERAPAIDIYGVNTYGDLGNVKSNIKRFGWEGPYIISEWGPNGHWEVQKTKWGVPVEQNSTEKADSYEKRYRDFISGDKTSCLGSYVFLWGQKQETTSTWYGLFSENGESCEAIDRLEFLWTGKVPLNSSPSIDSLKVSDKYNGDYIAVIADERFSAEVFAKDKDKDGLKFRWVIVPESTDIRSGGDAESTPKPVPGSVIRRRGGKVELRAPEAEGSYRLFLTITDGHEHYAYGNVPFYVMPRDPGAPPSKTVSFKRLSLQ